MVDCMQLMKKAQKKEFKEKRSQLEKGLGGVEAAPCGRR